MLRVAVDINAIRIGEIQIVRKTLYSQGRGEAGETHDYQWSIKSWPTQTEEEAAEGKWDVGAEVAQTRKGEVTHDRREGAWVLINKVVTAAGYR